MPHTPTWLTRRALLRCCVAEVVGTYILCLFGTGSVAAAVLSGAQAGLWQVAAVWGWGVTIAIFCTAGVSGAHLNPAVSLAFALLRPKDFSAKWLGPYILAQFLGAILASLCVWACWHNVMDDIEAANGLTRGQRGSEKVAMIFGEYFPNPGFPDIADTAVSPWGACLIEGFGTAVLALVIFATTNDRNAAGPQFLAPLIIGFTVAALISLFAPLTQAGWNPARDWGPRVTALMAGYKDIAFPGPRNGAWVYFVGPMIGAPLGGWIHDVLLRDSFGAGDDASKRDDASQLAGVTPDDPEAPRPAPTEPCAPHAPPLSVASPAASPSGGRRRSRQAVPGAHVRTGHVRLCEPGEVCEEHCLYTAPVGTAMRIHSDDVRDVLSSILAAAQLLSHNAQAEHAKQGQVAPPPGEGACCNRTAP
eukprot:TRINITY_DN10962_c0_g1_i1.p1 TRINITY_DN10962_c0_g1~~TRINITY_DN10962_c0_g1_i1.p1  ORF type:complete len:419 (+),score=49.35 TRINITY_DN10962_c0_g1_i1:108-1364(+)